MHFCFTLQVISNNTTHNKTKQTFDITYFLNNTNKKSRNTQDFSSSNIHLPLQQLKSTSPNINIFLFCIWVTAVLSFQRSLESSIDDHKSPSDPNGTFRVFRNSFVCEKISPEGCRCVYLSFVFADPFPLLLLFLHKNEESLSLL